MISRPNVKVNFGLHIFGKRQDGYHDIETLFVPCHEFHDTLEIVAGDDYSRTGASLFARYAPECIAQGISPDGKVMITIARAEGVDWSPLRDLCAQAYTLLDADFELPPVKIFLEKGSPVGAGLGGGSADAAFTLRMLSQMSGLGLSDETLASYASRLGSDCAFFIYNRPMIGSGRGEILEPFDLDLSAVELKVVVPEGISVSTAEAYRGTTPRETLQEGAAISHPEVAGIPSRPDGMVARSCSNLPRGTRGLREILSRPVETWRDTLVNDFEPSVFASHPALAALKTSLYDSGALYVSLSGSGSALFALYGK